VTGRSFDKHLQAIRRELRVRAWNPARVEAGLRELAAHGPPTASRFERAWRSGRLALAVAAAFALGLLGYRASGPAENGRVSTAVVTPQVLPIGEGIEAHFEAGASIAVREKSDTRVVLVMQNGAGRFQVRHDPRRLFRVEAGGVVIEDIGTVFSVDRRPSSVFVSVAEGAVIVSFADAQGVAAKRTLAAGESGEFPAVVPRKAASTVAPPEPPPEVVSSTPEHVVPPSVPVTGWRELQRAGKHRRAYELLALGDFRDVRDEPGDLLLASDVARLSHHPADAAALLRRLLAGHARDPRAPSAAFTLGWVLMNELGRPREAARAFSQAESLAPRGNLAEDAMARAAEAWLRGGDRVRANAEVERYRSSYPRGRHLATLERLLRAP
jgi:transmembrane sensor